jgi:hypothetical protein
MYVSGVTIIRYVSGITIIRYVSGITIIRYAQNQKIGKRNKCLGAIKPKSLYMIAKIKVWMQVVTESTIVL